MRCCALKLMLTATLFSLLASGCLLGPLDTSAEGGSKIKAGVFVTPLKLKHTPITASLRVALDGKTLPRSNKNGYGLNLSTKILTFASSTGLKNGSVITASYRRW